MGKCLDQNCHDKVTTMETCLKTKVSDFRLYSILGGLLVAIAIVISPFILNHMTSFAENRASIRTCEKNHAVTQEQIKDINNDIAEISNNIEKMKKNQITKEDFEKLITTIKEVVKNGK